MAAAGAPAGTNTPGPSPVGGTGSSRPAARGLFGRSLLYVVVLSLQTVVAGVVSPVLAYLLGPTQFGSLAAAIALHQALIVLTVVPGRGAPVICWGRQGRHLLPILVARSFI